MAERHPNDPGNFSRATCDAARFLEICRTVGADTPDAIVVFCTSFRGAGIAEPMETGSSIPVPDSVSIAVEASMRDAVDEPGRIRRWGRLFDA